MRVSKNRNFSKAILILLLLIAVAAGGCRILHPGSHKKVERKEAAAQKRAEKEYSKAVKSHNKLQSKDARKMMKNTGRQASKYNDYKRRRGFGKTKCD